MIITNKFNVPELMVDAIKHFQEEREISMGGINKFHYSVTQLLDPPTIVVLKKRHYKEIEKDVSDMLYILQGQVIHQLLELSPYNKALKSIEEIEKKRYMIEERLMIKIDDFTVSGQIDCYDKEKEEIMDYKYVGVKSAEKNKEKYFLQVNMYKYILEKNGYPVKKASIALFYRDWSEARKRSEINYPNNPIDIIDINLSENMYIKDFMKNRINTIKKYENMPEILPCNEEDRFQDPRKYAVMKPGAKRAAKLCDSNEEAIEYIVSKDINATIEIRNSEPKRCINYCEVNLFCPFYQELLHHKDLGI